MMRKIADFRCVYKGYSDAKSVCRLRVFTDPDRPAVVVASELAENPGTSVTNRAEVVASQACRDFQLDPESTLFLEHYGPFSYRGCPPGERERFCLVTFDATDPGRWPWFAGPRFLHREPAAVAALVGAAELAAPPAQAPSRGGAA
jgi:hypothetical protein